MIAQTPLFELFPGYAERIKIASDNSFRNRVYV